jgi:hypothetical protein
MSIRRVPKDKTPQVNMKNVYRRGSEGQNTSSEQEKLVTNKQKRAMNLIIIALFHF